jgi:hypothetical protein
MFAFPSCYKLHCDLILALALLGGSIPFWLTLVLFAAIRARFLYERVGRLFCYGQALAKAFLAGATKEPAVQRVGGGPLACVSICSLMQAPVHIAAEQDADLLHVSRRPMFAKISS